MCAKQLFIPLLLIGLVSCGSNHEPSAFTEDPPEHETIYQLGSDTVYVTAEDESNEQWYIYERLPFWFIESGMAHELIIEDKYRIDNRLNPMYLEEDFNGDGVYDLALPITEIASGKVGFVIVHGKTNETFIIGAGTLIEGAHSDDLSYIDIWRINREKENAPGLDENGDVNPEGPLHTLYPSLKIEKSEVGGGLIYWTGEGYAYFHQTC